MPRTKRLLLAVAVVALLAPACGDKGGIPDVVGMDVTSAKEALADAGFTNVTTHVVDGPSDVGFERDYDVVTQDPSAGADVAPATPVDLGVRFSGEVP